jgi:hypothetical protein
MSRLNIWVKDISHDPLIETSRQLHYYMYWSQYLQTTYRELSAEKDALFNAHNPVELPILIMLYLCIIHKGTHARE